ncbi:hypothetical protein GWI33_001822, partial [Rhynchophorus ferrugineus]
PPDRERFIAFPVVKGCRKNSTSYGALGAPRMTTFASWADARPRLMTGRRCNHSPGRVGIRAGSALGANECQSKQGRTLPTRPAFPLLPRHPQRPMGAMPSTQGTSHGDGPSGETCCGFCADSNVSIQIICNM